MSEELSDAVVLERLAEGLKSMPALPRAVFIRHRFDDASYPEIAAELRITVAEVEGNIAAAILHLHRAVWT
ncbi:sigma factor-like helix-turn-helix DNA-binding protein [Sphingomonas sp. RT2P30]|uniref:sigma factor-like helix-turn-helix DNA-binding protein n=1 Tax=Parasphingomonas halimpatiens TaxID=3096162 RepID=UPI002FC98F78